MTLLYAAFAVVALWLLGELLLQRRAPLHWRGLALVGFLVLVAGVAQRSLPLIGLGVVAFGAGQALATRAVKRSDGATYWSLMAPESVPLVGRLFGGEPSAPEPKGRSRRGRSGPAAEPAPVEPTVEPVLDPQLDPQLDPSVEAAEAAAVFQADEYAAADSVYYPSTEGRQQEAAYYGYTAEQQVPYQESYAQGQYQESYAQQQYQEYPQYQQQYAAYESYEQQPQAEPQAQAQPPQAQYGSEYAQYYEGYDYGQTPYYTQDPQYHAPQG
ncbi:hypothetical protein [Streptacidiphilus neutrinimicus]|uniref:hypothetical protein n=1 Tax=Streptacidiphilus neutrinimicus TaxID=105420 RepID=UPI000AA49916|nr:hypothetical protein [Streptacidiphilus neutrinimicus]